MGRFTEILPCHSSAHLMQQQQLQAKIEETIPKIDFDKLDLSKFTEAEVNRMNELVSRLGVKKNESYQGDGVEYLITASPQELDAIARDYKEERHRHFDEALKKSDGFEGEVVSVSVGVTDPDSDLYYLERLIGQAALADFSEVSSPFKRTADGELDDVLERKGNTLQVFTHLVESHPSGTERICFPGWVKDSRASCFVAVAIRCDFTKAWVLGWMPKEEVLKRPLMHDQHDSSVPQSESGQIH